MPPSHSEQRLRYTLFQSVLCPVPAELRVGDEERREHHTLKGLRVISGFTQNFTEVILTTSPCCKSKYNTILNLKTCSFIISRFNSFLLDFGFRLILDSIARMMKLIPSGSNPNPNKGIGFLWTKLFFYSYDCVL